MRRLILLVSAALLLVSGGAVKAAHCGEGGSPHDDFGNCETSQNQVRCSRTTGTDIAIGRLYVSDRGVQACNDGSGAFPLQGRIGASASCLCAYADGDADNTRVPYTHTWGRLGPSGYHCNAPGQQSYNSGQGQELARCIPL